MMKWTNAGADPRFPVGGGANPGGGGGAPIYDFPKFSEKLHEIEKNFGRGRGTRTEGAPPLDPPLLSALMKTLAKNYPVSFTRTVNVAIFLLLAR